MGKNDGSSCVGIGCLALIGLNILCSVPMGVHSWYEGRASDLSREHRTVKAQALLKQEMDLKEEAKRLNADLRTACGGGFEGARKDPTLALAGFLRELALACSPPDSEATIRVDNFSEFEVDILPKESPTKGEAARITKRILKEGRIYIHAINFCMRDGSETRVVKRIDRGGIDQIKDLEFAADNQVAELFYTP